MDKAVQRSVCEGAKWGRGGGMGGIVADPDPGSGSGAFLPLDPGWVKNQDPDPEWTTRIIFPRA